MAQFMVGDRVKVKPARIDGFLQPWRGLFAAGRVGVIVRGPSANVHGFVVCWAKKKPKYAGSFDVVHSPEDLELFARDVAE